MKKYATKMVLPVVFFAFITVSFFIDFKPGKEINYHFFYFFKILIMYLPGIFILIGLFEAWVKRDFIVKHLGEDSNALAYLWAILLSGSTVGGLYIAFPVAHSLYKKGARLSVIFTYVGAAGVFRIPMVLFEASYIGVKFTIIRIVASTPIIIITGIMLEKYLKNKDYKIEDGLLK